jgi:hypothetical protein
MAEIQPNPTRALAPGASILVGVRDLIGVFTDLLESVLTDGDVDEASRAQMAAMLRKLKGVVAKSEAEFPA